MSQCWLHDMEGANKKAAVNSQIDKLAIHSSKNEQQPRQQKQGVR